MESENPCCEHAAKVATRRALKALDEIAAESATLRRAIESGYADGDDTQQVAGHVRALTQHLAVLGALRGVREWHQADQAEGRT